MAAAMNALFKNCMEAPDRMAGSDALPSVPNATGRMVNTIRPVRFFR
jgi:hypothetical protein